MSNPDETIGNAVRQAKQVLSQDGGCDELVGRLLDVVDNEKVVRASHKAEPGDQDARKIKDAGIALADYIGPGPRDCRETIEAVSEILSDESKEDRDGRHEKQRPAGSQPHQFARGL
jgi:hypothetical protein